MPLFIGILIFAAITSLAYFVINVISVKKDTASLPVLNIPKDKEERVRRGKPFSLFAALSGINKPFPRPVKDRIARKIAAAKLWLTPEEFLLIKEIAIIGLILFFLPILKQLPPTSYLVPVLAGYALPEMWLRVRKTRFRREIVKALPDTIDLLSLCVNAGLDFMLAMKWVVEKSVPNILIDELHLLMREINLGKPRKVALLDLAKRYEIEELSSFSRSLVQADRMGTSVADALNILSEDMRLARFRRGEQMAAKAPIKMLVPLLFFIFPVVFIIIGGPILLQFMQTKVLGGL